MLSVERSRPQPLKSTAMNPMLFRPAACAALVLAALAAAPLNAQGLRPSGALTGNTAKVAAVQANQPLSADYIVAVVNTEPVTNSEVRSRLRRLEQQASRNGTALPPKDELTRQVLDALVLEKAQLQLAQEMGIKVDEAMIDDAERTVARQNQLTVEQMHIQLKSQGLALPEFRANLAKQLQLQRLREREVDGRLRVTEGDVDRFLAQKQDNPGSDLQLQIAQVLVAVPESADTQRVAALMSRAQMIAEKARSGADFAALAREFSDAPDRASGGDLGLRGADRYPVLFVDATRAVKPGGVAGPVRSLAGFHVLKVLEKRIAGMPDANITQTRARHILLRVTPQMSEAVALSRMAEYKKRIESGQADFAALAKEHSQDGSANDGGNLGWASPGTFVPEFEEVMNNLKVNQISEPIVSRFGVHLIQPLERRNVALTAKEQREQLRLVVREQKLEEAYSRWLEDIRSKAYVEMREPPQ